MKKKMRLHPVRLEMVTAPDVTDGGLADVLVFGHQAATPLRHPFWLGLKRRIDNGLDRVWPKGGLASSARRHFPQAVDTLAQSAFATT